MGLGRDGVRPGTGRGPGRGGEGVWATARTEPGPGPGHAVLTLNSLLSSETVSPGPGPETSLFYIVCMFCIFYVSSCLYFSFV